MNFKTTILLLVIVIAGGIGVFFYSKSGGSPADTETTPIPADQSKPVFEPQPKQEDIARVEIERSGKPKLVFEKITGDATPGENWRMVEPSAGAVEAHQVTGVIGTTTGLRARNRFEPSDKEAVTAAEAGLEPPASVVTLTDAAGKAYKLEVGRKAAMSSDTYVRLAGNKTIHLAEADLRAQLDKKPEDFRSKQLVRFLPDEVKQVRIEHEGKAYDFSKTSASEWVINEPIRAQADAKKVREKILTPLSSLRAKELRDNVAETALEKPFLAVTITTEKKKPAPPTTQPTTTPVEPETVTETQRLVIGEVADLKQESRFVKSERQGTIGTIAQASVTPLVPNLKELREPRVARVKGPEVTELTLTSGGATANLKKVNGQWQGTGEVERLDPNAVTELVDALANLSATDYVDQPASPAEYGLDNPRATITATVAGAVAPFTLKIGAQTKSGKNAWVQRADENTVYVTTEAQAEKLAGGPLVLRSRDILTFPLDGAVGLVVDREKAHYDLAREGGQWKFAAPAGAPVDPINVRNLATDLSALRAKRIVDKGNPAQYGLDKPELTLRVRVAPTTQPADPNAATASAPTSAPAEHVLRVAKKENASYVMKEGEPFVFELDDTVYRVMTAELIDARLFGFTDKDIARVKIVSTGGTLELARENDKWQYAADPYLELDQKKVQDFVREVAQMRAENWVQYQNADLAAAGLEKPPASVTIRLADGREYVMHLTQLKPGELPRMGALVGERRTFVARQTDVEKLMRGIDEYVKSDKPAKPEGEPQLPPGMPGMPMDLGE